MVLQFLSGSFSYQSFPASFWPFRYDYLAIFFFMISPLGLILSWSRIGCLSHREKKFPPRVGSIYSLYQRNYISGSWLKWQMHYSRRKPIMGLGFFIYYWSVNCLYYFFWSQENVAAIKNVAGNQRGFWNWIQRIVVSKLEVITYTTVYSVTMALYSFLRTSLRNKFTHYFVI